MLSERSVAASVLFEQVPLSVCLQQPKNPSSKQSLHILTLKQTLKISNLIGRFPSHVRRTLACRMHTSAYLQTYTPPLLCPKIETHTRTGNMKTTIKYIYTHAHINRNEM